MRFTTHACHGLIASPKLDRDPLFKQAVVYIMEQNDEESYGVLVNHDSHVSVGDLNKHSALELPKTLWDQPIGWGGPFMQHQLFALVSHGPQHLHLSPIHLDEIEEALKQVPNVRLLIGLCVWSFGQMEQELQKGFWLNMPPNADLVFNTPMDAMHTQALARLHIKHPALLSHEVAYA